MNLVCDKSSISLLKITFILVVEMEYFHLIKAPYSDPGSSSSTLTRFYSSTTLDPYSDDALMKHMQDLYGTNDKNYDFKLKKASSCARKCLPDGVPKLCYYLFKVEQHETFSKDCQNCPTEHEYCDNDGCITADGTKMTMSTVNKMVPGTAIHVCQGDEIVVDVENLLPGKSVSIHWHGIKHKQSQWMDGVSSVTQCPIITGQKFRYQFAAAESGTFFYHASNDEQHINGVAGPLIVRSPRDYGTNLYQEDLNAHTIFIQDVVHKKDDLKFPFASTKGKILIPDSFLINGRGRYREKNRILRKFSKDVESPFAEFQVEEHKKYRFRIIAATNLSCSIKLAIEKHSMTVITVDGNWVKPVEVRTVYMYSGERLDVVINTSLKEGSYWIRVQGNDFCAKIKQSAILNYEKHKKLSSKSSKKLFNQLPHLPACKGEYPPTDQMVPQTFLSAGFSIVSDYQTVRIPFKAISLFGSMVWSDLNNFSLGCNNKKNYCWEDLSSPFKVSDELRISKKYITISMARKKIKTQKNGNVQTAQSPHSRTQFATAFSLDFSDDVETYNDISCKLPAFPIYYSKFKREIPDELNCEKISWSVKECFHEIRVKRDKTVEIMFVDDTYVGLSEDQKRNNDLFSYDRSIHIHGYKVAIMKQGRRSTLEVLVDELMYVGPMKRYPIFKDTFSIPKDGFTIVRFRSSNPGIWALETPMANSNAEGVALVLRVGSKKDQLKKPLVEIPLDFSECDDYLPAVYPPSWFKEDDEILRDEEDVSNENNPANNPRYLPPRDVFTGEEITPSTSPTSVRSPNKFPFGLQPGRFFKGKGRSKAPSVSSSDNESHRASPPPPM